MPKLKDLITTCAETTRSKGFRTDQHATQITLIATEVAEALECVTETGNQHADKTGRLLMTICDDFEEYRKRAKDYSDNSAVSNQEHLMEELADICIRVFSYVGGNGMTEEFIGEILAKMEKNRHRPHLHAKGF